MLFVGFSATALVLLLFLIQVFWGVTRVYWQVVTGVLEVCDVYKALLSRHLSVWHIVTTLSTNLLPE